MYRGELGGDSVELLDHGRERVRRVLHERDEDGFAIGQVIELPVVGDRDLIWGET